MPMSRSFEERLFPQLPSIIEEFGTPFHVYDLAGILATGQRMKRAFSGTPHREYYAVKALPDPHILRAMHRDLGFGFDCSSIPELMLARSVGARGEDVMFTSNNTSQAEFIEALSLGGCILNLDDVSLIDKVPGSFPKLACFRINPGTGEGHNKIIGKGSEAKYGITVDQLVPAYRKALEKGATRFGLHTMQASNQLFPRFLIETVSMLLAHCETLRRELGIECEFVNMGGGFGIPYHPTDQELPLEEMASAIVQEFENFERRMGWRPVLFTECGRYVTGPHGALVSRVINEKRIYQRYLGVDTSMAALMRPGMYDAYHHIQLLDPHGCPREGPTALMSVVGSICENIDRLGSDRELPDGAQVGDIVVTHDTGAHGSAMGFNYNGRLRPQALLLLPDGRVVRTKREETVADLFRTLILPEGCVLPQ